MEQEKKEEEARSERRNFILVREILDTLIVKAGLHGYMPQTLSDEGDDKYGNCITILCIGGLKIECAANKLTAETLNIEIYRQEETEPFAIVESILNLRGRMKSISHLCYIHKKNGKLVDKLFEIEDNYPTSDERIKKAITDYITNLMLGADPEEYISLVDAKEK